MESQKDFRAMLLSNNVRPKSSPRLTPPSSHFKMISEKKYSNEHNVFDTIVHEEKKDHSNQPLLNPSETQLNLKIIPLAHRILAEMNAIRISPIHINDTNKTYLGGLFDEQEQKIIYYPIDFDETISEKDIQIPKIVRDALNYSLEKDSTLKINLLQSSYEADVANSIEIEIQEYFKFKHSRASLNHEFNTDLIKQELNLHMKKYPVCQGQALLIAYEKEYLSCIVKHIREAKISPKEYPAIYNIDETTSVNIHLSDKLSQSYSLPINHVLNLDFKAKGIGGNEKELNQIIREAFYSRKLDSVCPNAYGVPHTTGILLYGPTGTGKTTIAREIGKMFNATLKVINGPELKNKYVGVSEENLREVFADAKREWEEKGKKSRLHVIIFDEIDVLLPKRDTFHGGGGVENGMVTQFFTLLDGVKSPKNILVIGTTNRKDMIDPAALRPGRMGVHIEIKLPDESARLDILKIHTQKMKVLDKAVDLKHWAKETENFTGAEIQELVKKAAQYAMGQNFSDDITDLRLRADIHSIQTLSKVNSEHFRLAFSDISPAFGISRDTFNFNPAQFVIHSQELQNNITSFQSSLSAMKKDKGIHRYQLLITGIRGTGKSSLAKYFATLSGAKYIRVLTPKQLLGLPLGEQLELVDSLFRDAKLSEMSVIILDGLDGLLQASAQKNAIELQLEDLLRESSSLSGNKCIVIATTKNPHYRYQLGSMPLFNDCFKLTTIELNYENEYDMFVLQKMTKILGYLFIPPISRMGIDRQIQLSIHQLINAIKQFCSQEKHQYKLICDDFYNFVTENFEQHKNKQPDAKIHKVDSMKLTMSEADNLQRSFLNPKTAFPNPETNRFFSAGSPMPGYSSSPALMPLSSKVSV